MSQEKRKKRQKMMMVVMLMLVASTLTVLTIMHNEEQIKHERFLYCVEAVGSAAEATDIDIENWDEELRYCMIFGKTTGT